MAELELHLFTVGERRLLSVLAPEDLAQGNLPMQAVVGELRAGAQDVSEEGFVPNQTFHALLHWVVYKHGPSSPGLQALARGHTGKVHVVDRRTRGQGDQVPAQDILGTFTVEQGVLTDYALNPAHRLWTPDGFPDLEDHLHARLLEELRGLAR